MTTLKNKTSKGSNTFEKIQKILAENGAKKVMFDYSNDGKVEAISFAIEIEGKMIGFHLPAMVDNVTQILYGNRRRGGSKYGPILEITSMQRDQAYKTAWANIRDWIDAQMALVKTKQVELLQVFLPYAVTNGNQTLYDRVKSNPNFLLGSGE